MDGLGLCEKKIDFIKIDVEGFKVKALLGMKNLLLKYAPVVFVESFECAPGDPVPNSQKLKNFFASLEIYKDATADDDKIGCLCLKIGMDTNNAVCLFDSMVYV